MILILNVYLSALHRKPEFSIYIPFIQHGLRSVYYALWIFNFFPSENVRFDRIDSCKPHKFICFYWIGSHFISIFSDNSNLYPAKIWWFYICVSSCNSWTLFYHFKTILFDFIKIEERRKKLQISMALWPSINNTEYILNELPAKQAQQCCWRSQCRVKSNLITNAFEDILSVSFDLFKRWCGCCMKIKQEQQKHNQGSLGQWSKKCQLKIQ